MFTTKQLTTPTDLVRFQAEYQLASKGVSVNFDYLQRARQVVVVYRTEQPDVYLGGYIINDTPPHRYFTAPGETAKNRALAVLGLDEENLVEIGAIWLKKYQSPYREFHRLVFFRAMLRDALKTGKPYILGGSFIEQIQKLQRQVLPGLIFQDLVTVGEFTGELQLYVGSRENVWPRFAKTLIRNVVDRLTSKPKQPKLPQGVNAIPAS